MVHRRTLSYMQIVYPIFVSEMCFIEKYFSKYILRTYLQDDNKNIIKDNILICNHFLMDFFKVGI